MLGIAAGMTVLAASIFAWMMSLGSTELQTEDLRSATASAPSLPSKVPKSEAQDPTREKAAEAINPEGGAPTSRPLDRRQTSLIATSAALGLSFDLITDDGLLKSVHEKLDESEQDKNDAYFEFHRVAERLVISKMDRHDFVRLKDGDDLPRNDPALVNVLRTSSILDGGAPVQVVLMRGESPELDAARDAVDAINKKRINDLVETINAWNAKQ